MLVLQLLLAPATSDKQMLQQLVTRCCRCPLLHLPFYLQCGTGLITKRLVQSPQMPAWCLLAGA
jgi:hypothetical protein